MTNIAIRREGSGVIQPHITTASTRELSRVGDRYDFLIDYARIIWLIENHILLTKHGDYYSRNTIQNYKANLQRVVQFCKATNRPTLYCDQVTFDLIEEFRLFFLEAGYTKNGINGIVQNFRAVAKRLWREGKCPSYGDGIVAPGELVTAVALSLDELKAIMQMDLSETPGHDRVRRLFVLHCFTGLRLTDMFNFIRNPILYMREREGRSYIEYKTQKTGEVVWIPVGKSVHSLLQGFIASPWVSSSQYYNRDIKEVIAKSPIERRVEFSRTEGGVRINRTVSLSSLISSHTARRTFATNAYLSGIDAMDIMRITGHKTVQSFMRYIRCDSLQVAEKIKDHEFFSQDWLS